MLLYVIGFLAAIISAMILHKILNIKSKSFFVVEMPNYKLPLIKNVVFTVIEKTKSFVYGAGKIILAISIVLWFLGSNGYSDNFNNAEKLVQTRVEQQGFTAYNQDAINQELLDYERGLRSISTPSNEIIIDSVQAKKQFLATRALKQEIAGFKLENSYIGIMGKAIEPAVQPLGYDWKIGIAVLTSFAAREVFVGTLATIYSVGNDEEETIKNRMAAEVNPVTKEPLFNLASGISLLLFYAFAMQCMSTLAVVKRETNSWKWPLAQLVFMSAFAYLVALIAYQLLK
jgi:ferrous iron transport protein B